MYVARNLTLGLIILSGFTYVNAQSGDYTKFEEKVDSLINIYSSRAIVADTLQAIGDRYYSIGDYDDASLYFTYSLKLREEINSPLIYKSYLYLGNIAYYRGEKDLTFTLFNKALKASVQHDSIGYSRVLNNIGICYDHYDELDSALVYLKKALTIKIQNNDPEKSISTSQLNLGKLYESKEILDSAEFYYRLVVSKPEHEKKAEDHAKALNNLGFLRQNESQYDSALYFYHKSLELSEEDSLINSLIYLYFNMYSTYRHINLDSAESFLDKHLDLQEYLFNLESDEKIKELRELYDIEKTQKELANKRLELSRQSARTRMFLISGGTVILMLIGLIIFYAYRQKLMQQLRKKDDAIHNQQVNEIMRTQELSVLNARVEGQDMERQRIAEDLHDRLGSKLSAVKLYYDSVENEEQGETISKARVLLDETIDETRRIAHNLSSGVLAKFGLIAAIHNLKETLENTKKVEIEFIAHNFDNHEMSKELEENFYRIIQELISNILKHAHASHISIQLTRHEDMSLTLMIEDNGIGFNPQNVSLNSMGLTNLKNRVERFHGSYTVDSEPGHGTTVIVEIDEEQKYTVS